MSAFKIPNIFTAVDRVSTVTKKMGRSAQTFATKTEIAVARADRAYTKLMTPLTRLKKTLGTLGLFIGFSALVSVAGSAVNVFKDFEQANAGLAAVMGSTVQENKALAEDAKRLGATTAKTATEVVGLQEAFARLGFQRQEILNMTESTIAGSVAMQSELADTAELVGAMVKSFDKFSSIDTPQIIDQLTLSTSKSALNFEKLQTSLPIVAGAANAAGIPFTQLLALLGKLSDAGIDASSSATSLRNIFLESAKKGHSYSQILEQIVKKQDLLTAANDEFGKRAAVSAVTLSKNIKETAELEAVLNSAAKGMKNAGAAQLAADKQLDTLSGRITILGSAWEGFILSLEDGSGPFASLLNTVVMVATEMLSLASGTAVAGSELDESGKRIRILAERGIFWLKVLGAIAAAMAVLKIAILVSKAALIGYNIVLGVTSALSGTASIAVGKSAVALGAYKVATAAATAATWLLNVALSPITLIVLAIVAAIAIVVGIVFILIKKWNEWGAAITLIGGIIAAFFSPVIAGFALIISLVQSFRRNWDMIKEAFQSKGVLGGLMAIGKTIFDAILMPLQQVLEIISKIPVIGDAAGRAAASIASFRQGLGVNVATNESGATPGTPATPTPLLNPEGERQRNLVETIQSSTQTQNVNIGIADETGRANVESDNNLVPVNLTPTFGF